MTANINGNKHNLNDFISKNNLIGSNVYISPMNNSEMYLPSITGAVTNPTLSSRKIISDFFPSVDLN